MTTYIALVHKDPDSCYGVSFPDLPGVVTAADSYDAALRSASDLIAYAAVDWQALTGSAFPRPRSRQELDADPAFLAHAAGATVVEIRLDAP